MLEFIRWAVSPAESAAAFATTDVEVEIPRDLQGTRAIFCAVACRNQRYKRNWAN